MNTYELRKTLAPRVKKGAAFLDKKYPSWYTKIKVTQLNMGGGEICILGQIGASLGKMVESWGEKGCPEFAHFITDEAFCPGMHPIIDALAMDYAKAAALGFDVLPNETPDDYQPGFPGQQTMILDLLWLEAIDQRKAKAKRQQ